MNQFTKLFSRENLEVSIWKLISRFAFPSILLLFLAWILFYTIDSESESSWIIRSIFALIVTFILSVGVRLFSEAYTNSKMRSFLHILPWVYGIIFYFSIDPTTDWWLESMVYFLLHLAGFISLLFFAPYLHKLFDKEGESIEYTNYFSRIAWTIFMSFIVGGSLLLLGFIAIASVIALFDLSALLDEWKWYGNWAVIALVLLAPIYGLLHLPMDWDLDKKYFEVNRFFSFLVRYIAIPFICIYFIILYAYSVKVLMNFSHWPKGMISWMVIGFSTFGYITYIFSKPYDKENLLIAFFRKYFPLAVLPQLIMLFYAIYLRITQYDLTMNRYFVVIFGLWLFVVSLYLVLSRKKSLAIITASLTLISLLISVWPWSVYTLPLHRQYDRLTENLALAGILKDGKIVKLDHSIDMTLENDIYSGIQYVCDFSECEYIKNLFSQQIAQKEAEERKNWPNLGYNNGKDYPGISKWQIVSTVTEAIGVSYRYENAATQTTTSKYKSYMARDGYNIDILYPLDTKGYDRLVRVYGNAYGVGTPLPSEYITIDPDDERMILHTGTGARVFLVGSYNRNLEKKYLNIENNTLDQKDLVFMTSSGGVDIKIILQNYAIKNPNYTSTDKIYNSYAISGYALIKWGK